MLKNFSELKMNEIFYDPKMYVLFKKFGFDTIDELINVSYIMCPVNKSVKLRNLESAFKKIVNAGIDLEKMGIFNEENVESFFAKRKKCKNCGKYYVYSKETDFCSICENLNRLSSIDNSCYMYYSKEKEALVVRNCSSKVIDFDLNVDDAYLVINNREENLVEDDCILEFQSGILPKSERVFIDLSDYNNDKIQSIVVVSGEEYYEFTREDEDEPIFLKRVINSVDTIETSFYANKEYRKGEYRNCKVDLFPLVKNEFYKLQKWFNNTEDKEVTTQYKIELLKYSFRELGIKQQSSNTTINYSKITLDEFLQYEYEDLVNDFAREDLIKILFANKFSDFDFIKEKIAEKNQMSDYEKVLALSIKELELSNWISDSLILAGKTTLKDLLGTTEMELMQIMNSIDAVQEIIYKAGLWGIIMTEGDEPVFTIR